MGFDHLEAMQFEVIFFCYNRCGVNLCDLSQNLCSLPKDLLIQSSDGLPHHTSTDFSLGTFLLTLGITWVIQVG